MRVHIDTDFGGDPDDACALAMLLGWPGVEIVGITTNLEHERQRAACVVHYLDLAGRRDVPVAAGADAGGQYRPTFGDARYWPHDVAPFDGDRDAIELLDASIDMGATIVAIGAFTNLARVETRRLRDARVVATAGWFEQPEQDFNTQCDPHAAALVAATADLTLVTLPAAMEAQLRARDLPRLRAAGPVGALLARQSEAYAADNHRRDPVNFHWDPVTAAVAVGWPGATTTRRRVATTIAGGVLAFRESADGRPTTVMTQVDGPAFGDRWLAAIEALPP